jgi:NADPH:quinone reductase-like Zn-dependent oxidoreductase
VTRSLVPLLQQQYRTFGAFGAGVHNIRAPHAKMADGLTPVIDAEVPLAEFERGLDRLAGRQVFGKVVVTF